MSKNIETIELTHEEMDLISMGLSKLDAEVGGLITKASNLKADDAGKAGIRLRKKVDDIKTKMLYSNSNE